MPSSSMARDVIERGESFVGSDRTASEERSLCREDLVDNVLRKALERSPCAADLLSEQALEDSLQAVLCAPHRQPDVWVFGYGSLIWNPVLDLVERGRRHPPRLSSPLLPLVARGPRTPERPGLVLGLDRGGLCHGVVYRISGARGGGEITSALAARDGSRLLCPRWTPRSHGHARPARSPSWSTATDPVMPAACRRSRWSNVDPHRGTIGTGLDYLRRTIDGLAAAGIRDPHHLNLDTLARQRLGEDEPHRPRADLQL